jgi:hypothetical protein
MGNQRKIFRCFINFDKEEAWLEGMSAQGWHLKGVSSLGIYTFAQGEPEQRIYKIDFRQFKNKRDFEDYVALFADSGWTCLSPRTSAYNYYFYAPADGANREIFSDLPSKAQRNLRFATYMGYTLIISLLPYLTLYLSGTVKIGDLGYQTPGLWSMQGSEFIFHFLFETPFVLLRGFGGLLPFVLLAVCGFFIARSYQEYRKAAAV